MRRVTFLQGCNDPSPPQTCHGDKLHAAIEDEIKRLLALLDRLDGDPDAEPDDADEPSLGWTLTMAHGNALDLEVNEVAA